LFYSQVVVGRRRGKRAQLAEEERERSTIALQERVNKRSIEDDQDHMVLLFLLLVVLLLLLLLPLLPLLPLLLTLVLFSSSSRTICIEPIHCILTNHPHPPHHGNSSMTKGKKSRSTIVFNPIWTRVAAAMVVMVVILVVVILVVVVVVVAAVVVAFQTWGE
jgi:maltodextrin utilization protein YvdJ